ncbi:MAG TPA: hypothetical protein VLK78_04525 [Candidatus Angelobacter sp.]|nr:hypothetical protein [Candidatus Angelobacter sp.]
MGEVISLNEYRLKKFEDYLQQLVESQDDHLEKIRQLRLELLQEVVRFCQEVSAYNQLIEDLGQLGMLEMDVNILKRPLSMGVIPLITKEHFRYILAHHKLPEALLQTTTTKD